VEDEIYPPNMRTQINKLFLVLSAVVWVSAGPSVALSQMNNPRRPAIEVHISVAKRAVTVGEVIHVEVRVSNTGDAPTLVPNTVSTASGGFAYLELELTDAHGHSSGGTVMIADYAPVEQSDDNAAAKLLGSWTLLYPQTSLLFDIPMDKTNFTFLGKPGEYTLFATYASNGILYGRNTLGLSKELLSSLPYSSWHGKVSTNEISLTVVPPNKTKK
jgi:hypothetical protein